MGEPQAIVAVLAGGRGQRIGGSKALSRLAGQELIRHPLRAARAAGLEAVVVAKPATALPAALKERVLREPEQPRHPLCGAITALRFAETRSPAPAVLLLACDMPFLTAPLLVWLASLDGAVLAELDGRVQPLPARVLPAHRAELSDALLARSSLREALGALTPRIVGEQELSRFGSPKRLCFNVNDSEDLQRAESWLPRGDQARAEWPS
jgi:molybdenum cofactor guanylyltransferase